MDIKKIVDNPEWQELRGSLVGTWKNSPVVNVQKLRVYLGDFRDWLKLKRVHNYLTGTAFRIGRIQHPEIDTLLNEVRLKLKEHGGLRIDSIRRG
jgi:hypothetical protein